MIKGVRTSVRRRALACAAKQDQTMGEWITRAIATQENLEAGERILPPLVPGQDQDADTRPALPTAAASVEAVMALSELIRTAVEVGRAGGLPVPKTVARQTYALLGEQLRAARGLPPKRRGLPRRQTLLGEAAPELVSGASD
jgi:hypothetical protein